MLNIRGLEYESPSADWLQIRQWVGDRDAKEEKLVLLECDSTNAQALDLG